MQAKDIGVSVQSPDVIREIFAQRRNCVQVLPSTHLIMCVPAGISTFLLKVSLGCWRCVKPFTKWTLSAPRHLDMSQELENG